MSGVIEVGYWVLGYLGIGFAITVLEVWAGAKRNPGAMENRTVMVIIATLILLWWPAVVMMWLAIVALSLAGVDVRRPKPKPESSGVRRIH